MNNEQFERRMEFIVEQQAQFSAGILELKEAQKAEAQLWRDKHDNLTDAITTVVGMIGRLADGQERLTKAQERTGEQLSELTNKHAETGDRLNALIGVVERSFSGNGQKPKPKSSRTTSAKRRSTKSPRKRRR
jgi:hypothetical protein